MRILKVSQTYYPYLDEGGRPVKVRSIARRLAKRGHSVTVLTADLGPGLEREGVTVSERSHGARRATEDGVEAVYLRTWGRYRAVTLNPGVIQFCFRRLKLFDLVHIYGLYDLLGPCVGCFCRRWRTPYIVEPMGMFRPIVRSFWLKRFYLGLMGRRLIEGARYVIATSEQELKELVEDGVPAHKVVVRRNGVELPDELPPLGTFRRRWGIHGGAKTILFLGRLVPKKSPDLLLEVLAAWLKDTARRESAILVLAGPTEAGDYAVQLRSLAKKLDIETQVLFTGPLYGEAKWAAYRDADVFVLPSQNENFGNTVGEALACGTPVVVTDRCGIAPLVQGRAGLVVPYDRQALQSALTTLLEDVSLREGLRAQCREVAAGLSWEEPVSQMEILYAQSAAAGRPES